MLEEKRQILEQAGSVDVVVRVRPHAAKTQFIKVLEDGSLKVDIAAPAEENRGNIALVQALSEAFSVPAAQVKILSGKTARMKLVRVSL